MKILQNELRSVKFFCLFLEKATLAQGHDDPKQNTGDGAVNLMTIHLAKGLEFDNVFIIGCTEGVLPHHRSYATNDGLEEERRLMYVAITRAAKNLFLSFFGIPSRFLYEIPSELVEFANMSEGFSSRSGRLPDEDEMYIEYD